MSNPEMPSSSAALSRTRVLIVDNIEERRDALNRMLREKHIEVLEADSCESALTLLRTETVPLVLTETELPTKSGLFLLQKVKQKYPDTEVILITHNASSYNLLQALRNGAYDFIVRPIDTGEILYNSLERAFGHVQLRQQNSQLLTELARNNRSLTHSLKMFKALNASIERVAAAMDIETLFMELLTSTMDVLQSRRGFLALFDRSGERLALKVGTGIPNDVCRRYAVGLPKGVTTAIAARGKPVLVRGPLPDWLAALADAEEQTDLLAAPGLLAAPLKLRGRVVGIVTLSGSPPDRPFTEHEMHFLIQLSHHAALALEKAGVIHQLRRENAGAENSGPSPEVR
jgi:CheY-like chemotaxis protein